VVLHQCETWSLALSVKSFTIYTFLLECSNQRRTAGICSTHRGDKKCTQHFCRKHEGKRRFEKS